MYDVKVTLYGVQLSTVSPRTATSTRPKVQLGRDVVIDRALSLADVDGLDGVTIRRLAQEFGVTPMALYWHFRSKDELLAAMGDRLLATVDLTAPAEGTVAVAWDQRLQTLLTALVGALRAHPPIAPLAAERIMVCAAGMDLTEQTLALLRGAGFDPEGAAMIAHHALMTALMLVTGEPGAEGRVSEVERKERHAAKLAAARDLDPERYPNVIASFGSFVDCKDEDAYYFSGVDLFIAGVRGLHAAL